MENQDVTFERDSQEIYNVWTKSVVPEPANNVIVSHFKIGHEFYSKFLKERICGGVSVWSALKKRNIGSFKSIAKRLTTKLEGKVIDMREDKTLLRRLPYRGKLRRGKVTKFSSSDENFPRRKFSPTKLLPRRIFFPNEYFTR